MSRRRLRLILVLSVLGAAICGTAALLLVRTSQGLTLAEALYLRLLLKRDRTTLNTPVDPAATPVVFVVNPGDTAASIGTNLAASGLISDSTAFRNYARYHGLDARLEAGAYFVSAAQTIPEIANLLTDSSQARIMVSVIEGWRREQIAAAIDANPLLPFSGTEFMAVTSATATLPSAFAQFARLPEGATLEGFLYPDTYAVPLNGTAEGFRNMMLENFQRQIDAALLDAITRTGMSLYEVVTLASIVEREAVIREEQPLIAGVYLNRLRAGMPLDADPTVQYGIGFRDGNWWPSITQADYRQAVSPYNTYLNPGLPPGPIANPSLSAIRAVVYPAESPYYYFRADCAGSGYHVFAETFEEHLANGNCNN
ncbi:MAG: endolytic transglycosylase MltG [Anaerolineae bacterium]